MASVLIDRSMEDEYDKRRSLLKGNKCSISKANVLGKEKNKRLKKKKQSEKGKRKKIMI